MRTDSVGRVPASTSQHRNNEILRATIESVEQHAAGGHRAITRRLAELDREWDIERVTMLSATIDAFATLGIGVWRGRRWLVGGLAFLGAAMLAHVVVGQCPSLPLYRRLGFRTRDEIDYERYALKLLRGDFDAVRATGDAATLVHAMKA